MWEREIRDLLINLTLYQFGKYPEPKVEKELTDFLKRAEELLCKTLHRNGAICYAEALHELHDPAQAVKYVEEEIENWKLAKDSASRFITELLELSLEFRNLDKMSLKDKILLFDRLIHSMHAAGENLFDIDISRVKEEADRKVNEILGKDTGTLKNIILELLKQEGRPVPLKDLIDVLKQAGYANPEKAIEELERSGFVRVSEINTIYGREKVVELAREPQTVLVKEERPQLSPYEERVYQAVVKAFGGHPEIVDVGGTKTAIVNVEGEKLNIALGEIRNPEMFEPLTIEGKVWYVKKSPALERLKRKRREKKVEKVKKPTPSLTEFGALEKYLAAKEAIDVLKRWK